MEASLIVTKKRGKKSRYCGIHSSLSLELVGNCQSFLCESKGEWVGGERNYDRTNTGNGDKGKRKNRNKISVEK
jgi:hypothetical protein